MAGDARGQLDRRKNHVRRHSEEGGAQAALEAGQWHGQNFTAKHTKHTKTNL
jgi:hypothetical protein